VWKTLPMGLRPWTGTSLMPSVGELDAPIRQGRHPPFASIGAMTRVLFARPMVQDTLIAAMLTATSLIGVLAHLHVDIPEGATDIARRLDALGIALVLLQTVPLVWRRKAPVLVLSVITASLFMFSLLGYFPSFVALSFLVALYTLAAERDRQTSIPAGIAGGLVVLLIAMVGHDAIEPAEIIAECLIVGAVWFLGDSLRIRRAQMVLLEDRAKRLEQERELQAQRAVAQERRLIARELHDVVSHNVSVIVAQAGGAQRIFASQPEEALAALAAIERIGREALVEMRRLMGFLRTEADRTVSRSPQPGMNDLHFLVSQVVKAGVRVELKVEGTPKPLPAGLDLSAFRIVQEALTNVLKHAGSARAEVIVRYGEDQLELTINDDGWGPHGDGESRPRYGHLGMRERVALFGGELLVGPRPGGGYRVAASLPLDGEPS
jgi:signal transduction histidine kinase